MRDRTPTLALENGALRYGVYDEAGNLLRYEYLALEDDPTDPGTDLSKATLLQDSTEVSLFGDVADRTVDDAFSNIAGRLKLIMSDSAKITLTLQDSGGHRLPGVLVQGILSDSGAAVYSNVSGVAAGYIGEGSKVIKISGYADIEDYTETLTVVKGTTITKTLTLTTRDFFKVTSSGNVKFSGNVKSIDHSVVGGGGGGQGGINSSWNIASGSGGWAGSITNTNGVEVEANVLYPAVIGSGGSPGAGSSSDQKNGSAGGASQFMGKTATGGSGGSSTGTGTGNAKGGAGQNATSLYGGRQGNPGTNGSMQTFKSFSEMETGPGGGGGGAVGNYGDETASASGGAGGKKDGAMGGTVHPKDPPSAPKPAPSNSGAGGGGGASCRYYNSDGDRQERATSGSKGGSGFIAIRMHLKSAA